MYNAYITRIKNLRKHTNADRLQCGECFGNTVIVSMDYVDNQLGVYFPTDGQLSQEYAEKNNLLRKKDDAGNNIGGYMDPIKRNVTAIRLRGEKSDGLFMPIESLRFFGDISKLNEGDIVSTFNGKEIAIKYIPYNANKTSAGGAGARVGRRAKRAGCPTFFEHKDTEQLAYNLNAFKDGDILDITLKMHGTSQRTGYLKVLQGYKRSIWDKLFRREGTPIYDYGYISGTRRTVLDSYGGGFYGSNAFRERHSKKFEGKLMKGETVYYEVVGYTDDGGTIMGICDNKKLNDKEFVKKYGEKTIFSYGCTFPANIVEDQTSDLYVYRMTMTNEDGFTVDYTPDFMRYRCEQMGVKTVPLFNYFVIPAECKRDISIPDLVMQQAELYYDGPDPIGKTHVREGVVVRIVNRPNFTAFKLKNFSFKCLEGIVKAEADAPDMEEVQEVEAE